MEGDLISSPGRRGRRGLPVELAGPIAFVDVVFIAVTLGERTQRSWTQNTFIGRI